MGLVQSAVTTVCVQMLVNGMQVRASVVAVTLEMTEEELFFQFGMDNWSAYVDQVSPCCINPTPLSHADLTILSRRTATGQTPSEAGNPGLR